MLNSFKDIDASNSPYNTPFFISCPICKGVNSVFAIIDKKGSFAHCHKCGLMESEDGSAMMGEVFKSSRGIFHRRCQSETVQSLLISLGLVDYMPSWNLIGAGVNTSGELPEEYLTIPISVAYGKICSFHLYDGKRFTRTDVSDKKLPESITWSMRYDTPNMVVCSSITDMSRFLSQNREMFGVTYSLMTPLSISWFLNHRLLHKFTAPGKFIFLGREPWMFKMKGFYSRDIPCRILKEGVEMSDCVGGLLMQGSTLVETERKTVFSESDRLKLREGPV